MLTAHPIGDDDTKGDLFATRLAAQGLRAFIYLDIAAAAFLSASVGSELCVVIAASALPRAAQCWTSGKILTFGAQL
jgi:hypothetical protein